MSGPRFSLGRLVATPGALERVEEHGIALSLLLGLHAGGDWGDLDPHDKAANEQALESGGRLFSSYGEGDRKLYIITEAIDDEGARQVTTILRPEDY